MKKILSAAVLAALLLCLTSGALAATGLGSVTTVTNKAATADAAGSVGVETTLCAVTLDEEGKITAVSFDMVLSSGTFDATGALTCEETITPLSKVELGEGYGMKVASAIGKEWYEQMEALEDWCIGKTVDEVLGTLNEAKVPDGVDLKAGCTVSVSAQMQALEKAAAAAK